MLLAEEENINNFAISSFKCGGDYHAPTDCETIKRWLTKCADDSETANYISAHTKDVSPKKLFIWPIFIFIRQGYIRLFTSLTTSKPVNL